MKFRDYSKYEIYEDGKIWSYSQKKFLKPQTDKDGYQMVTLTDNEGKQKTHKVHRVVWEAVTGKPIPENLEINHRSEDKTENMITNLELVSHKQNMNFGTCSKRIAKALSKQVGAFKDGKLVMRFPSTMEAGRNGFNQCSVSACCRNCYIRPGNNVFKGLTWKYL